MVTIVEVSNAATLFEIRLAIDGPFEETAEIEKVRQETTRYVARENGRQAFLAVEDGLPVGYVEIMLSKSTLPKGAPADKLDGLIELAYLDRIGLTEPVRGKGIATMLLTHAKDWVSSNGKTGMWLDYKPKNKAAERLYSRFGFAGLAEFQDPVKKCMRRIVIKQW